MHKNKRDVVLALHDWGKLQKKPSNETPRKMMEGKGDLRKVGLKDGRKC